MSGDNLIGTSIGNRYKVESELGRGALGVVFKAKDEMLDRHVAVKVMQEKLNADNVAALRFQREARLAASLQHPNIVTIFDFGVLEDNRPYLVMECLAGETVEDVLNRSIRMNASKAVPLFMSVCQALAHAHKSGIVHRDLKPANIVLLKDDTGNEIVKLVDFGIAKQFKENQSDLTEAGSVIGTPSYMSPEQCLGKPLDSRSDIYALGCVMYHVLTGVRPLTGQNSLETLHKQVSDSPRAFGEVASGVPLPDALERCVFRALMKSPADRHQSVIEVREELEQAMQSLWSQKGAGGRGKPDDEPTVVTKSKPVSVPEPFGFSPYPETQKPPKVVQPEKPSSPDEVLDRAQRGDGYAMHQYGAMLENGTGVRVDEKEALFWYRKSCSAGCPEGQNEMASIYQWGALGVEANEKEAIRLYFEAAQKGHARAQNSYGYFTEEDNPREAIRWYKASAEGSFSLGMSNYGRCLYYGIGSDKKFEEAFKWLTKAAEADDTNDGAQYMLGILYFNGDGVDKDLVRAAQWYRKAAENGNEAAQYELALCYVYGEGVEPSTEEAIYWLKAGSALGNDRCEEKLAELISQESTPGLTVDDVDHWMRQSTVNSLDVAEQQFMILLKSPANSDLSQVVWDLQPAAEKGDETAMLLMGRCWEMGMGVAQDFNLAYDWYKRAYDLGSDAAEQHAITCLRSCFENNIFPEGAEAFLRSCANKRNTKAMISLAYFFRFYNPDGRDFSEALRFYRQAAESGDSEGQYLLGRFLVMKNLLKRERNLVIRWWDNALEKGLNSATTEEFDDEGHKNERAEAMRWLNAAGEEGSCEALRLLSSMYHRGLLVLNDSQQSVKLLARAADMEDMTAQGLLGVIFLEGIGVEQNEKQGIDWLELASEAGNSFAQWNLSLALIEGTGVLVNRPRAKALLEKSAEGQFAQDKFWSEDGFAPRFSRLVELFQDLAGRGQVDANYWLGICYEKGLGLTANRDKALELYLRAAREGCSQAQAAFDRQPENLRKLAEKRSSSTKEAAEVNAERVGISQAIKVVRDADTVINRLKLYEALNGGEVVLPGADKGNGNQPLTITNARGEVGIMVFSGRKMIEAWDGETEFVCRTFTMRDLCSIALSKSMEAVILDATKTGGVILRKWEMDAFAKGQLPIERGKNWTWAQVTISSGAQISLHCADADTVARCGASLKKVLERHQMVKRGMIFSCFFEPISEQEQLTVGIEPQPGANKEQAQELNSELAALDLKSDAGLPLKVVFITNPVSVESALKNSNVLFER
ncbi:MAG: SEL1-like repeat protein [Candidatus Melainabacteria bacterium]|nr:SEL1-like repeat protein [Candidatus Melainabacteria bacterium]